MNLYIGQKVKHKKVYNGKEVLEIAGIKQNEVLLRGDFSGGTHPVTQETWMQIEGIIHQINKL